MVACQGGYAPVKNGRFPEKVEGKVVSMVHIISPLNGVYAWKAESECPLAGSILSLKVLRKNP